MHHVSHPGTPWHTLAHTGTYWHRSTFDVLEHSTESKDTCYMCNHGVLCRKRISLARPERRPHPWPQTTTFCPTFESIGDCKRHGQNSVHGHHHLHTPQASSPSPTTLCLQQRRARLGPGGWPCGWQRAQLDGRSMLCRVLGAEHVRCMDPRHQADAHRPQRLFLGVQPHRQDRQAGPHYGLGPQPHCTK